MILTAKEIQAILTTSRSVPLKRLRVTEQEVDIEYFTPNEILKSKEAKPKPSEITNPIIFQEMPIESEEDQGKEELGELHIADPLAYEQLLIEGELENEKALDR